MLTASGELSLYVVTHSFIFESFGRSHKIMNVNIFSLKRSPQWCPPPPPPITVFSLWSVFSFYISPSIVLFLLFIYLLHLWPQSLQTSFTFLLNFLTIFIHFDVGSQYLLVLLSVFQLFLHIMIEAKLGNELGFVHTVILWSYCPLVSWETNKYMNKLLECVSAVQWCTQEV
jgi:hypothetical protein